MKKVLYVITKSNWGGAQRYVYDLALASKAAGFDVAVALGGDGLLAQKLQAAGTMIYHSKALERDVSLSKDIKSFFEIYRLFKKIRPDIVHLNSSKAGALGALAGRMAGVPNIIFTDHGWAFAEKRSLPTRAAIWLVSWLTALMCHQIVCVSDSELSLTKTMPFCAHKAIRIYNGIGPIEFDTGDIVRHSFPVGVKITGTVGELTHNKNQISLIEQARHNPNMYIAIVGDGEDRRYLLQKIEEYGLTGRVIIFGFMWASQVLRGFDTFALPSQKEALAYVILEARAAGLPIVANRVGGVSEALDRPLSDFSLEQMIQKTLALY